MLAEAALHRHRFRRIVDGRRCAVRVDVVDGGRFDACLFQREAHHADGPVGITLRVPTGPRHSLTRTNVCSLCITSHAGSGVALLAARRAGAAGREGNTVGTYVCADLACSLYVRGLKKSALVTRPDESLPLEDQIARTVERLDGFLAKVLAE